MPQLRNKPTNLGQNFGHFFGKKRVFEELDERKRLTIAKQQELLLVLEHPELPLHNNPAELAARTMVLRRKISYSTQTWMGTKSWDIFMSLVDTTRKLGISFFEYISDRTSKAGRIPPLATIIRSEASVSSFSWSWSEESLPTPNY